MIGIPPYHYYHSHHHHHRHHYRIKRHSGRKSFLLPTLMNKGSRDPILEYPHHLKNTFAMSMQVQWYVAVHAIVP